MSNVTERAADRPAVLRLPQSFPLAPMSQAVKVSTGLLLLLPAVCAWQAPRVGPPIASLMVVTYALVWLLFRPRRFVVTAEALRIEWPLRSRAIPLSQIVDVTLVPVDGPPRGIRFGVGGLWGVFGLLIGSADTVEIYASRRDGLVRIDRRGHRALVVSPDDAERFAEAVRQEVATAELSGST